MYLEDLLPDQMIEYGEVLPKSGQEKKMVQFVNSEFEKKIKKIGKKN